MIMPNDLKKLEKDAFPLATSFVWRYSKNEDEVEDEAIDDAFWTGRTGTMYVPDTDKWNCIIQQLDEKKITWTKRIAVSADNIVYCQVAAEDGSISEEYWADLEYDTVCRFDTEGTITFVGNGEDGEVCIPNEIRKASVKKLILKNNNIILGEICNEYMNLYSVEMEVENSFILEKCFKNLKKLQTVRITGQTTFEEGCFYGCSSLKKLEISGVVRSIGDRAFEGCTSLTQVNIKAVEIGKRAFFGCENLKSVELPVYTSKIQQDAFGNCPLLQTIVLPEQLSYVGLGNFTTCNIYWKGNEVTTQDPEEGGLSFFEQVTGTMYIPSGSEFWQKQKETYPEVAWEEWKPVIMQPETETYDLMEQWAFQESENGVPVEAGVDDDGVPCIKISFSKRYQRVAFKLPEQMRAQDYATVSIKAKVGVQLMFDLWDEELTMENGYAVGTSIVDCTYPFWYPNDDDPIKFGTEDVGIYNNNISDTGKKASYMSIGICQKPEEAESYGRERIFYIYSITFNPLASDTKKLVFESKMPEEETPAVSQTPSATPQPTETSSASQVSTVTPVSTQESAESARVESSAVTSKKKSKRSAISIHKKRNKKSRYVQITVKSSVGSYFDLYMKKKGKKFVRIRLSKNSLKKGKRVVKLAYSQKGYTLWFKVRTYDKINGKKKYRAYSRQKKIRL